LDTWTVIFDCSTSTLRTPPTAGKAGTIVSAHKPSAAIRTAFEGSGIREVLTLSVITRLCEGTLKERFQAFFSSLRDAPPGSTRTTP
jgi:hypothetical protein